MALTNLFESEEERRRKALQQLAGVPTQLPAAQERGPIKSLAAPQPTAPQATSATPFGQQSLTAPSAPSAPPAPGDPGNVTQQQPTPPTIGPPSAAQVQSVSSWKGGAPDPRDATYWADVAKLLHTQQSGLGQVQFQQTQAEVTRRRALEDLSTAHARNQMGLKQRASASGRLYGTTLGVELSDEQTQNLRNVFRTEEDFTNGMNALAFQRQMIESGFSVDEAAALAAASYRYAQNQMAQAQLDALNRPPPAPPAAAPAPYQPPPPGLHPGPAAGPPPGTKYGDYWTGTRWVPIGQAVPASHGNYASGPPPSRNHAWVNNRWVKVR